MLSGRPMATGRPAGLPIADLFLDRREKTGRALVDSTTGMLMRAGPLAPYRDGRHAAQLSRAARDGLVDVILAALRTGQ